MYTGTALIRKTVSFCLTLIFPCILFGQTNTWDGSSSNNWNTAANWSLNLVPTAAHDVVININASISVDATPPNLKSLTINGGATVSMTCAGASRTITIANTGSGFSITNGSTLSLIGSNTGGGRSMNIAFSTATVTSSIAGTLTLTPTGAGSSYSATNSSTTVTGTINNTGGTITSTSSNLTFASGGSYIHALNGGVIPTATWNAASNCTVTGITATVPTGLGQSFGNFTWNCSGHSTLIKLDGALTTVNGNFTVSDAGNFQNPSFIENGLSLTSNNNLTLNIGGNFNISTAIDYTWLMLADGNGAVTVNVGGNFNMSGTTAYFIFHFANTNSLLNNIAMNVTGDFTKSDGLIDFAYQTSTGAATQSILRVGGNFSHTGAGFIQTSTTDADIPNGKIVFNKNGTQTFSATTPANISYTHYEILSGSTVELLSNLILTSHATPAIWGGKFTVNSGGVLDAGTFQLLSSTGATAGVNNEFTLSSGAGLITANTNGVQNANAGTISTSLATRTFSSAANYTYDGTAVQNSGVFTTTPTANEVNNLTINNTAGNTTSGVTLEQPFAVAGTLSLSSGHLTSSTTNLLTLNAGATVSGANYATRASGGSDNSFVNGPMRKNGNTDFLFPVGKLNAGHHYCGISAPANATDAFTAEYIRNSGAALGGVTALGLHHVSNCEYWDIQRTAGTAAVNVTLSWSGSSNCNAAVYINDLATLVAAHFGSSWDAFGNDGGNTGTVSAGSVTWLNVSTFSPFTLGSTSVLTNPLPVKFVNVSAYAAGTGNKIEWANLTESAILNYEVQRSSDGISFSVLGTVSPRGNAGAREDYMLADPNSTSTTWYRISATGLDGSRFYSTVVRVDRGSRDEMKLNIYPNPVTQNQFTLQLYSARAAKYEIRIVNNAGQQVAVTSWMHQGGAASRTIGLPDGLQAGVYHVQVMGNGNNLHSTIFIR